MKLGGWKAFGLLCSLAIAAHLAAVSCLAGATGVELDGDLVTLDAGERRPPPAREDSSSLERGDSGMLADLVPLDAPSGSVELYRDLVPGDSPTTMPHNDLSDREKPGDTVRVEDAPSAPGETPQPQTGPEMAGHDAPPPENAADKRKLSDLVFFDEPEEGIDASPVETEIVAAPEPPAELAAVEELPSAPQPTLSVPAAPPPALPDLAPERFATTPRPAAPAPVVDPAEVERAEAAAGKVKLHCEADELDLARSTYDSMPEFGYIPEINKYRADSANLLVLNYCMDGEVEEARRVYDSLPKRISGDEAMIGKARTIMNLVTFYIRGDSVIDAYELFLDLENIENHTEVDKELFRLVSRMIPYLDNAGEHDKAAAAYEYLLRQVKTPETIRLFCDSVPGLAKYLLARPVVVAANPGQEERLALMLRILDSLDSLGDSREIARLRLGAARAIEDYYIRAGDDEKARAMHAVVIAAAGKVPQKK